MLVMSNSVTPWTIAHQALLSLEFSKQEYWSGLPFPPPKDLPDPGIKPVSPASHALAGRLFTTTPAKKPYYIYTSIYKKINNEGKKEKK